MLIQYNFLIFYKLKLKKFKNFENILLFDEKN